MDTFEGLEAITALRPTIVYLCCPVTGRTCTVSPAAEDHGWCALSNVFHRCVVNRHLFATWLEQSPPPSTREPSASQDHQFLIRTLANVPRIMISWLPTRTVGVEVSFQYAIFFSTIYQPGWISLIEPAGEIWSVVMESPNTPKARAPLLMPVAAAFGSIVKSAKNGGSAM